MNSPLPIHELEYYDRTCDCCGSDDFELIWVLEHDTRTRPGLHRFRMANGICRVCGFIYVRHSPTPASLESYYKSTFSAGQNSVSESNVDRRVSLVLKHAPHGARVIDIGAGKEDDFHRLLIAAGMTVVRMDVKEHESPDSAKLDAFAPCSADVVTHNFVLEHVPDVRGFLADCYALLKTGGFMIVDVPDLRSYPVDWMGILPHEHVNHFSAGRLAAVLDACGFDVLEASQDISCRAPIGFAALARKRDQAQPAAQAGVASASSDYEENKRCFMAGVKHVREHEEHLCKLASGVQADLNSGKKVLIWCANDRLHRLLQLCGPWSGDYRIVDSDPRKKEFLTCAEVFTPDEAADFIRTCDRILIFSDLNAVGILGFVEQKFGRRFGKDQITTLGIYKLC